MMMEIVKKFKLSKLSLVYLHPMKLLCAISHAPPVKIQLNVWHVIVKLKDYYLRLNVFVNLNILIKEEMFVSHAIQNVLNAQDPQLDVSPALLIKIEN